MKYYLMNNFVYGFLFLFVIYLMLMFYLSTKVKPEIKCYELVSHNRGKITKLNFEGHSYVGWSLNLGCGIVHDPDCECNKERK